MRRAQAGAQTGYPRGLDRRSNKEAIGLQQAPALGEREAQKVFGQAKTGRAMAEYEKAQEAFQKNRERLKAERLVREAAEAKRTGRD